MTMSKHSAQVSHRAARHPYCCFFSHRLCSQLFELEDSGVFSIDVVPNFSLAARCSIPLKPYRCTRRNLIQVML